MAVRIESQAEPLPGYKLIERLGGGGFGEVWKAEAPGGLLKAIKFVYGDLQEAGEDGLRAEQELKALSRVKTVRHPYILSLERYDILDGQLMIVMELADRNLWDRFKECRAQGLPAIPRHELLGYMEETAEALDLMNIEFQLQHLDIKPQNIFLMYNHVKVADFGLVKDLEGMVASVTGGVTPVYAAPETFDGWVSRFSDQYSLAIVYQELLTGHRPFSATSVRQLILQHLQAKPDVSSLPAADRDIINRALAKNPEERYPNCRTLVQALRGRTLIPTSSSEQPDLGPNANVEDTGVPDHETPHPWQPRREADLSADLQLPVSEGPAQPATCWIRPQEEMPRSLDEGTAPRPTPPPVHADGILVPALVIGLGDIGLGVLQHFREDLHYRFGGLDALPHLRLLLIDTDPGAVRRATQGGDGAALAASEVLLARLNRPSHYLKARDGRAPVSSWLDSHMLYRIPRSLETTGIRALGRVAFCDNYSLIVRRLRSELEQCTEPGQLLTAERRTGLGMRSNRPRVYIVTSLLGGTGSGMFLDLAYVVRHLLRQMGYGQPELHGVFLLPGGSGKNTRSLVLGNTFAALTELNHFSEPRVTFTARYLERGGQVTDSDAPFGRCVLLPLPEDGEVAGVRRSVGLAGEYLLRDLTTPLGRAADLARAGQSAALPPSRGAVCQTFGLYRLSFPKRRLVHEVGRRVCQRLLKRWMTKESKPLQEIVRTWAEQQWAEQQLGAEHFIERLQQGCECALGGSPESHFASLLEPYAPRATAAPGKQAPPISSAELDLTAVRDTLFALQQLVGKPEEPGAAPETATLPAAVTAAANEAVLDLGRRLSRLILSLIEQPEFRLAGAEEAVRQTIPLIQQVLEHHETLNQELTTRARDAYQRIHALVETLQKGQTSGRRPATHAAQQGDLLELLRLYPKWRYQSLIMQQLSRTYVSLRGNLSDQLREINFSRARLGELLRSFEPTAPSAEVVPPPKKSLDWAQGESAAPDLALYPAGARTMEESAEQLLQGVTAQDLLELDRQVQVMIREQFTGLNHVCMTSANLLKNVERAILAEAEGFILKRLTDIDVAELFREVHPNEEDAASEIEAAFTAASPTLGGAGQSAANEICVLASPPGAPGDRFRDLARRTLTQVEVAMVAGTEDLLFYRELSSLPLGGLEQIGPLAYEAYSQIAAVAHFTPHTRTDITQWRAARSPSGDFAERGEMPNQATILNGPASCSASR